MTAGARARSAESAATAGAKPRIRVIERVNELAALRAPWRELRAASGSANPFLSWEWIWAWFTTFAARVRPWIGVAQGNDGELLGALALERSGAEGTLACAAASAGADDADLLLHPRAGAELAVELCRQTLAGLPWRVCRLAGVAAAGPLAKALEQPGAWAARASSGDRLPVIALPRGWNDFLAAKSENFRSEARRRRRRWEREPNARLEVATSPPAVEAAMEDLFHLHNARRAMLGGAGLFADELQRRFHRRLSAALAGRGEARVYRLLRGETPVAALYGLAGDGPGDGRGDARGDDRADHRADHRRELGREDAFYFFQGGWDPQFAALSPGAVLMGYVVEDLIARGASRFELLRGDEPYKLRWATGERRNQLWVLGRGWRGRGYLAARGLWRRLRGRRDERGERD